MKRPSRPNLKPHAHFETSPPRSLFLTHCNHSPPRLGTQRALVSRVRLPRDFRPQQLYAVTQRGYQGQWVYRDAEDFEQALIYMRKYTTLHGISRGFPVPGTFSETEMKRPSRPILKPHAHFETSPPRSPSLTYCNHSPPRLGTQRASVNRVRLPRDFRPQQLYATTQRGNQGQWVYATLRILSKRLLTCVSTARSTA